MSEIQGLIADRIAENEKTRRVLEAVPERQLGYKPHPKARTAGELAWHLVTARRWFLEEHFGVALSDALKLHLHKPETTAAGIVEALDSIMAEELAFVRAQDDFWLKEELDFFGRTLTRAAVARQMMLHECHHRGQLTTYLRAMGAAVPGIYGESADEQEDRQSPGPPATS